MGGEVFDEIWRCMSMNKCMYASSNSMSKCSAMQARRDEPQQLSHYIMQECKQAVRR